MKLEEAKKINELYWHIMYAEGNITSINRYLNRLNDPLLNYREDNAEVRVSTYYNGSYDFKIDEECINKAAKEMLAKETKRLAELNAQLSNYKLQTSN